MIVRTVKVDGLEQIKVAMDFVNGNAEEIGMRCLKQVLMTKPRTQMIKRTPLATTRRYKYYNRKDGGRSVNASFRSGNVKALRNAVQNTQIGVDRFVDHVAVFCGGENRNTVFQLIQHQQVVTDMFHADRAGECGAGQAAAAGLCRRLYPDAVFPLSAGSGKRRVRS